MYSTLFKVFGLPIRAYGLMLVIGFAAGLWRAVRVSAKRGIDPERVYDLALVILLSSILGARLVYVLMSPTESFGEFFAVWNGGLSFHGGALFAVVAGYVYTRLAKLSFWKCADLIAPSAAIGYAVTRIGCFLNGCCYGVPTSLPWGVRFEHGGAHLHPTQVYAAIASLLIFVALTRLERLGRAPGFVFASYLGLYSIYRFLIEFLRAGATAKVWLLGLTEAQWASIAMLVVVAPIIFLAYRRPDKSVPR